MACAVCDACRLFIDVLCECVLAVAMAETGLGMTYALYAAAALIALITALLIHHPARRRVFHAGTLCGVVKWCGV